jgi:hypothetical protein
VGPYLIIPNPNMQNKYKPAKVPMLQNVELYYKLTTYCPNLHRVTNQIFEKYLNPNTKKSQIKTYNI